jgi:polyisoprenoid-binding protein YceI
VNTPAGVKSTDLVGKWILDEKRTTLRFRTRVALLMRANGTLRATRGNVHVGADGIVTGEIVIDPASIDTGVKKRDDHLRSADFFEVHTYPEINFSINKFRAAPSGEHEVDGSLNIHGRSTPISLLAVVERSGESASLVTEVEITKTNLGMKKANLVRSWVTIEAHFTRVEN